MKMIEFMQEPYNEDDVKKVLNPLVRTWFFDKFNGFSLPQLYGVLEIHNKNNVLVSAPTGGTKCLTPDETVLIKENRFAKLVKGEGLIKRAKEGILLQKIDQTGRLYKIKGLESYSLQKNMKISKREALIYHEDTKDRLLKIKTEYGREVKLSKEHPLLVEGKGWIKAKKICIGDKIAVPRKIDLPSMEIELEWKKAIFNLRKMAKICITYEDYIFLKKKTNNFRILNSLTIQEKKKILVLLRLSYNQIKRDLKLGISTVHKLINNEKHSKIEEFYKYLSDHLQKLKFEKNRIIFKTYGKHEFSFKYPKFLDIRLAKWVAFILAEGLIGDYKNGTSLLVTQKSKMNLLKDFLSNSKSYFDINFKKKNEKDYCIHSTLFCYFINDLFSIKRGRGRYIEFPEWLLNCKRTIKNNFLNIFFSLEATLTRNKIKIVQANKQKIEVINYLLLSNGIFASIGKEISYATNTKQKIKREYYTLTIRQIPNLRKFFKLIGIEDKDKKKTLEYLKRKSSGQYVNKLAFDYKKIRALSKYYKNDLEFKKDLGSIYEVVRRTGYITEESALRLLGKLKNKCFRDPIILEIAYLINRDIIWLKIKDIKEFNYKGVVFDLSVPDVHNFVGGYGGIILHNTLTAFLSIINELINLDEKKELKDQVYCVYVSPLKALNRDVEKNLKEPLQEIEKIAGRELGIRVAVRTGDTTASEKQKMLRKSPHVLITTPESLALMLTSIKFKELLKNVKYVIIDEVHALADNKRGVHLSLSLERLQYSCNEEFTRIGLSATCAPLESIAGFLVGNRDCKIANVEFTKKMDLKVISPVKDLINVSYDELHNSMYNMIDNLIQEHKTTLIFTNTRSATERVVHHLREKFPKKYTENIGAHHGSLSKKHRHDIEDRLRKGELKCVVTSTALELGIDIGYIDLVICLGSPKSVARFLQRTGRSGHRLHDMVKGRMIVLDRDDLVECSVLLKNAIERKIDRIHIPENCLDVLSQQIYGIAIADKINIKDLFKLIKSSYCYRNLEEKDFDDVINYLAGEYISLEDRNVYAKIWHDEETGMIGRKGKLARVLYMTNIGTIPDETFVLVKVQGSDEAIGTIEESFLERLKRGDVFVLGGARYEFLYSKGMVAYVNASVYRAPTIPSWFSEMLPLSFDLAMGIQVFRRQMEILFKNKKPKKDILEFINSYLYVEDNAALAIYNYFNEQFLYIKEIPNDKKLLIEFYRDEEANKKYAVFHSLYGRRVNDVLSRAIAFALGKIHHSDFEIGINDNGFYIASNKEMQVLRALSLLKSKEVYDVAKRAIENTEVLKRRFRHCATRALMILRQYKGHKKRVGKQQVASQILINALKRIDENFSILKEARREVLEDLMDIENATSVIKGIEEKKIEVKQCSTNIPSPFAFNIVLQGYTDVFKIEDKMQFLKRMHDMVLAKIGKENRLE